MAVVCQPHGLRRTQVALQHTYIPGSEVACVSASEAWKTSCAGRKTSSSSTSLAGCWQTHTSLHTFAGRACGSLGGLNLVSLLRLLTALETTGPTQHSSGTEWCQHVSTQPGWALRFDAHCPPPKEKANQEWLAKLSKKTPEKGRKNPWGDFS